MPELPPLLLLTQAIRDVAVLGCLLPAATGVLLPAPVVRMLVDVAIMAHIDIAVVPRHTILGLVVDLETLSVDVGSAIVDVACDGGAVRTGRASLRIDVGPFPASRVVACVGIAHRTSAIGTCAARTRIGE